MASAGSSADLKTKVFVWDMDETLILLKSLLSGEYAEKYDGQKSMGTGFKIGKEWEDLILRISDDHFFYEQVENCNKPYLDVMSDYDDRRNLSDYDFNHDGFGNPVDDVNKRKLAYRHRVIAEKYSKGLHNLLDQNLQKSWAELYDSTDIYTDRWLSSARMCLEQCATGKEDPKTENISSDVMHTNSSGYHHVNVLVTNSSLIPTLVKCLLFRLNDFIAPENVYSAWEVGKRQCFSLIKERFSGPNVKFCVIGDGWEECEGAEAMRWPFVKVDPFSTKYHRFPGLTLKDLDLYLSVIYGNSDDEEEK